jgi:uncharacterized membrane protein YdfJ with MMPL/SSD domain
VNPKLTRLTALSLRFPKRTLLVVLILAVAGAGYGGTVSKRLRAGVSGFQDPSSESSKARDAFFRGQHVDVDDTVVAVLRTSGRVDSATGMAQLRVTTGRIVRDPAVSHVDSYATGHDSALISLDGHATYIVVGFRSKSADVETAAAKRLLADFRSDPRVTLGGSAIANIEIADTASKDLQRAELLVFPLLFLLLLRIFRGGVAASLPLVVGLLAIVGSTVGLRIVSNYTTVSIYAMNLATGLGLGLGIDYSLLIVSRYREELVGGVPVKEALERTLATAGRTVLFSSLTVGLALGSLLIFPEPFLYSMGIAGVLVATTAGAVALLVLPALLAVLGRRVNSLSPKRWRVTTDNPETIRSPKWGQFARWVMRHPARIAVTASVLLLALGSFFLRANFTFGDPGVLAKSAGARQVYDTLQQGFPLDQTYPILIAADVRGSQPELLARRLTERLSRLRGVVRVSPAQVVAGNPSTLLISIIPARRAISNSSEQLVNHIRSMTSFGRLTVGGYTAQFVDLKKGLVRQLPVALALIVITTLILVFVMTRSVILPLKTVVMNVLTGTATLGVLVLVFQDGNLQGLLGFRNSGAIGTTEPIVLMALAFALSTDYAVFLLARIKEEHDRGRDNTEAVAAGLERVGRIVTAAAVLFAVALGALVTSQNVYVKQLGLGAAVAVLIDATVVRAFLVPSLMALLGRWNWWLPKVFERRSSPNDPQRAAPRRPSPRT